MTTLEIIGAIEYYTSIMSSHKGGCMTNEQADAEFKVRELKKL